MTKNILDGCTHLQELIPVVIAKFNSRYGSNTTAKVGEVLRTTADQQAKYAQGRTAPGGIVTFADGVRTLSTHQAQTFHGETCSHACDIDLFDNISGRYITTAQSYYPLIGICAVVGLYSGGDWLRPDVPHCYCPESKA